MSTLSVKVITDVTSDSYVDNSLAAANSFANAAATSVSSSYNTANAAFTKANTSLQNTSGTFAGNLGVSGNVAISSSTTNASLSVTSTSGGGQMIMQAFQGTMGTIGSTNNIGVEFIVNNTRRAFIDTTGDVSFTGNVTTTQVFTDSKGEMRNIPLNNQSSTYTLVLSDAGKVISTTGTVNVPNGVFFSGNVVSIYNNSASTITIANNFTTTMYLAGTSNVINRLVAQRGVATILCVSANTFVVSGAGVT